MNFKKNNLNTNEIIDTLNGIKLVLILILVVFTTYTILFAISMKNISTNRVINDQAREETELHEYDVSKFKEVDYGEFKKLIASKGTHVIYIGRESCGYCAMFIPTMVEAQEKFDFITNYFDISRIFDFKTNEIIDQNAYDEMSTLNDFVEENFLATPMVLIFKDGNYVDGTLGYQDINTYSQFLETNEFEVK